MNFERPRGSAVSPACLFARKLFPAGRAKLAGGALAAAISPVEPLAALAEIAGVRLSTISRVRLSPPSSSARRQVAALSSHISGVRIVIALSMPSDSAVWVARIRPRRGNRDSRNNRFRTCRRRAWRSRAGKPKRRRRSGTKYCAPARRCWEGRRRQMRSRSRGSAPSERFRPRRNGYGVILAKTSAPRRRHFRQTRAQNRAPAEFDDMALAIVEADCLDARETRQREGEAGRRIPVRRRTAPARSSPERLDMEWLMASPDWRAKRLSYSRAAADASARATSAKVDRLLRYELAPAF